MHCLRELIKPLIYEDIQGKLIECSVIGLSGSKSYSQEHVAGEDRFFHKNYDPGSVVG